MLGHIHLYNQSALRILLLTPNIHLTSSYKVKEINDCFALMLYSLADIY